MENEAIFERNLKYLKSIAPANGYDLIYIDGDHSFAGATFDWEYSLHVCNSETLVVVDDINDDRHTAVRKFFESLTTNK